jgi:hypothetical protein
MPWPRPRLVSPAGHQWLTTQVVAVEFDQVERAEDNPTVVMMVSKTQPRSIFLPPAPKVYCGNAPRCYAKRKAYGWMTDRRKRSSKPGGWLNGPQILDGTMQSRSARPGSRVPSCLGPRCRCRSDRPRRRAQYQLGARLVLQRNG